MASATVELINHEYTQNGDAMDADDGNVPDLYDVNMKTNDITWSQIIGGCIGNVLEWFDFAIFGYLASEVS